MLAHQKLIAAQFLPHLSRTFLIFSPSLLTACKTLVRFFESRTLNFVWSTSSLSEPSNRLYGVKPRDRICSGDAFAPFCRKKVAISFASQSSTPVEDDEACISLNLQHKSIMEARRRLHIITFDIFGNLHEVEEPVQMQQLKEFLLVLSRARTRYQVGSYKGKVSLISIHFFVTF